MELTIQDVAGRLNIPAETIHRWIRQGKIPMQLNHGNYTIHTEILERWAHEHKLRIGEARQPAGPTCDDSEFDSVLAAMQRGGFFYDVAGDSKETAIRSAVDLMPNIQGADRDLIYEKLMEREALASTGIGHGIALPHPRTSPSITMGKPQITTCFLSKSIPYEAIDQRPVTILMVLLSCSTRQHLSMISKLSFFLRDASFRDYLLGIPGQEDILRKLAELESNDDCETVTGE
ncbi:MAG: PTS sugar transporter subunit IIA [Desulfosarcinaceae bacterium]